MNHPYFTGQVGADHQADLIDRARRHRMLRPAEVDGDMDYAVEEARRPRAVRPRPWTRQERQPHASGEKQRSPLPLFNLLLAVTALTVALVALATDHVNSGPAPTVVVPPDANQPAVAPDEAGRADEDVTDADQTRRVPDTAGRAGDCTVRRLVVRC